MAFSKNVFINCPFDDDYYPLLKSLLFTVIFCDLIPKISETKDGDDIRIRQISELIGKSKYSIHDISRIEPKNENDPPRFNMPLELGMDIGCKHFSLKTKQCLILEEKPYRYKEVISDISGQDISHHSNEPIKLIKEVRNWIYKIKPSINKPPNYSIIWDLFNEFIYDFDNDMKAENMDPDKMWEIPFSELIDVTTNWVKNKKKSTSKKRRPDNKV